MVLLGMVGYVLAQFAVGIWVSRRIKNEADYILAGRSLGPTLVAFSVFATWFGAEAIVATAGEVYDKGLSGAVVDPFCYGAAVIAAGALYAAALWRQGVTTFADVFRARFSPDVEKLVVVVLLPGSVFWAAAQIRAFGQVLSSGSSLPLTSAIVVAAFLVASYSAVGGLLADAVTDLFQGFAVITGLVVLTIAVASYAGGPGTIASGMEPERLALMAPDEPLLSSRQTRASRPRSAIPNRSSRSCRSTSCLSGTTSCSAARWSRPSCRSCTRRCTRRGRRSHTTSSCASSPRSGRAASSSPRASACSSSHWLRSCWR
jgi:Na+/proline symporter